MSTPRANADSKLGARRRLLVPLVVFCLVGLLTMVAGELALRVYVHLRGWTPNCYAGSLELFRPDPQLGYDLEPNFRLETGVYDISTNSLGLRGPEVAPTKPEGTVRIALLGGSSAFGYLVSDGAEAARLLQERLRTEGHAVEVLNAGVPGYNLFQTTPRFERLVMPLAPDIVVLYLGWNDLPYITSARPGAEEFRVRPVASWWERLLGHSTLYGFIRYRLLGGAVRLVPADLTRVIPTDAGKARFHENLQGVANAVATVGARLIVCAQASAAHPDVADDLRDALNEDSALIEPTQRLGSWLHDALKDFAEQRRAPFIDAYAEIPADSEMLGDYIHLTAKGERRLAELLAERLEPLVARESL